MIAAANIWISLGYEDFNDHDQLRRDLALGIDDVTDKDRRRKQDKGCPLAGKNTLNRLELSQADLGEDATKKNRLSRKN